RERAQAVVAREPSPGPGLETTGLEVDVVVDDEERFGLDLEEARGPSDRAARLVHVGLGLQQRKAEIAEPDLRKRSGELRAPGAAVAPGQLLEDHPAGVVPRALVLAARIAEPGDEQVQRRGTTAPTEEAHLTLGSAGLAL